jgi:hypothetical protein
MFGDGKQFTVHGIMAAVELPKAMDWRQMGYDLHPRIVADEELGPEKRVLLGIRNQGCGRKYPCHPDQGTILPVGRATVGGLPCQDLEPRLP